MLFLFCKSIFFSGFCSILPLHSCAGIKTRFKTLSKKCFFWIRRRCFVDLKWCFIDFEMLFKDFLIFCLWFERFFNDFEMLLMIVESCLMILKCVFNDLSTSLNNLWERRPTKGGGALKRPAPLCRCLSQNSSNCCLSLVFFLSINFNPK